MQREAGLQEASQSRRELVRGPTEEGSPVEGEVPVGSGQLKGVQGPFEIDAKVQKPGLVLLESQTLALGCL